MTAEEISASMSHFLTWEQLWINESGMASPSDLTLPSKDGRGRATVAAGRSVKALGLALIRMNSRNWNSFKLLPLASSPHASAQHAKCLARMPFAARGMESVCLAVDDGLGLRTSATKAQLAQQWRTSMAASALAFWSSASQQRLQLAWLLEAAPVWSPALLAGQAVRSPPHSPRLEGSHPQRILPEANPHRLESEPSPATPPRSHGSLPHHRWGVLLFGTESTVQQTSLRSPASPRYGPTAFGTHLLATRVKKYRLANSVPSLA